MHYGTNCIIFWAIRVTERKVHNNCRFHSFYFIFVDFIIFLSKFFRAYVSEKLGENVVPILFSLSLSPPPLKYRIVSIKEV